MKPELETKQKKLHSSSPSISSSKPQKYYLIFLMAFSISAFSCSNPPDMQMQLNSFNLRTWKPNAHIIKCESKEESARRSKLEIGSPVIIIEAPKMVKTAASVPCLRVNSGLIKPGDVGRIVSRKPKDLWAVRLSVGTYLIDGKYFKAFEVDE
ncbi:hypothetical protein Patl1_30278 [Pistacia atlantica]|uniref:Uncharacterized protein n=1 Tax=Pistacia atlantica TaxID=434234 RepID=A0ACC1A7L2_9ROSI|nr:hypothetical protein Patl1_30278 [Pistacia atlantica]